MLTVAPALHSLIICERKDVADIPELLFHKHIDLRKLVLKNCYLGNDSTGLLANIVDLYPNLEGLSLEGSFPLSYAGYRLISCLKKLSELNLSRYEVHYVYNNLLEIQVCIREHTFNNLRNTFYIFIEGGNLLHF